MADPKAPLYACLGKGPEEPRWLVSLLMKLPRCPFLWFQLECLLCVANFFERRRKGGEARAARDPRPSVSKYVLCATGTQDLPRGRKHAPRRWPSRGSLFAKAKVNGGSPEALGWRPGLQEAVPGFIRGRPTAPAKAQEGPLVETPENSPVSDALPPTLGLLPGPPPTHTQTQRHSVETDRLHPALLEG